MESGPLIPANNPLVREVQPMAGFEVGRPTIYPPQLPAHESALGEYVRVLIKRKWLILACLGTIFSVVAIASLRMTPVYEAGGTIEINKPDASLNFQNSATFSLDYFDPTELETEIKILQSDLLALQVIRELNLDRRPEFGGSAPSVSTSSLDLAPDPMQGDPSKASAVLGGFKGNLRVALVPNSRIIEVHYRSSDPQLAANIVNTLMQTYVENNYKARFESTMQASDWLQQQLVDMQMKVETSQEKLVRYQKEHEILGIDDKQNIITSKLDELNKALTLAESERMDKEALYRMVESGDPDAIASSAGAALDPGSAQTGSGLLETLRARQAEIKIQAADLNTQFGPSYPKLAQLNNQVKEIDAQLQSEMKKITAKVRGQYMTSLQRENMLREALEKQKQEANKLNQSAIEYNILKRDSETYRTLYEGLLQKLKEAGVSAGLKSNNFRVVDGARPPRGPIEPNIPRNLLFALVLGAATGVGLAFLLEGMDNTIRTTEQAQMVSGLASLGMIPLGSKSAREGPNPKRLVIASSKEAVELVTQVRPQSQMAESYRALRTSLLLSSLGSPPKVIMVTSALPQEGKTTTSINCAVVLAQKGVRVLLIDADLRRPSIHKTLGMGPRSGLSNVLTGSSTLEQTITRTTVLPNLYVLPAGTPPPNPAELLASPNMREVLNELSKEYDHIVVDTPPSLSVTDAVVLSPRADAVVLVIRSGQTTKQALRRSRDILAQVNAKVVGVLLNAVDLSSPDYYYYYEYQGKYAGYYRDEEASGRTEEHEEPEEIAPPSSSSA
ncbi:MAG TPA: polysaccharide biosynthesis tyrosine autokinase [Candidatus Sulfotelmatobacter sp.]|nr:polysaccharide biosynthesis tyrosine autokinase [Candidatus Sulfotelmatobacter sp.]